MVGGYRHVSDPGIPRAKLAELSTRVAVFVYLFTTASFYCTTSVRLGWTIFPWRSIMMGPVLCLGHGTRPSVSGIRRRGNVYRHSKDIRIGSFPWRSIMMGPVLCLGQGTRPSVSGIRRPYILAMPWQPYLYF